MDLGLRGRVCVVTGSTTGIGLEASRLLCEDGARVVVTGRDAERVDRARRETGAELGIVSDLAGAAAPSALIAEVNERLGPIDVLVNNVGAAYQLSFEDVADHQWDEMWQLNVMSYVRFRGCASGDGVQSSMSRRQPGSGRRPRCPTTR
jgi:3-oxoacyl-[acyl-carrier protein] reductase